MLMNSVFLALFLIIFAYILTHTVAPLSIKSHFDSSIWLATKALEHRWRWPLKRSDRTHTYVILLVLQCQNLYSFDFWWKFWIIHLFTGERKSRKYPRNFRKYEKKECQRHQETPSYTTQFCNFFILLIKDKDVHIWKLTDFSNENETFYWSGILHPAMSKCGL